MSQIWISQLRIPLSAAQWQDAARAHGWSSSEASCLAHRRDLNGAEPGRAPSSVSNLKVGFEGQPASAASLPLAHPFQQASQQSTADVVMLWPFWAQTWASKGELALLTFYNQRVPQIVTGLGGINRIGTGRGARWTEREDAVDTECCRRCGRTAFVRSIRVAATEDVVTILTGSLTSVPQVQPRAHDDKALQEYHARLDRIIAEAAE